VRSTSLSFPRFPREDTRRALRTSLLDVILTWSVRFFVPKNGTQDGHSTHFVLLFLKQLVSDEGFRDTCQKGI